MPIDFTNIQTTRGRQYDAGMISRLNDSLQALPIKQRAAILGSVNTEGTPVCVLNRMNQYGWSVYLMVVRAIGVKTSQGLWENYFWNFQDKLVFLQKR